MMQLTYFVLWLALCLWASSFVSRRVAGRERRFYCYLIVWLVPVLGAVGVMLVAAAHTDIKATDSSDRLFDAVIDAHRRNRD